MKCTELARKGAVQVGCVVPIKERDLGWASVNNTLRVRKELLLTNYMGSNKGLHFSMRGGLHQKRVCSN